MLVLLYVWYCASATVIYFVITCTLQAQHAQVVDNAREQWDKDSDKAALRKRVSFVGGDFLSKGASNLLAVGAGWETDTSTVLNQA